MKNLISIRTILFLFVCTMFLISCEKQEVNNELSDTNEQENFMSTTGKSDAVLTLDDYEINQPLVHLRFDGDLSKAEADAKFDEAVLAYKSKHLTQTKSNTTEWFYRLTTKTGTQRHAKTDGKVMAVVSFNTRWGGNVTSFNVLDNPGNDREGGWDYYLLKAASNSSLGVKWVEFDKAIIYLQGMDEWFVEEFNLYMWNWDNPTASGLTTIQTSPNVWLDNRTSTGIDSYDSGFVGKGRVTFPNDAPF
ncbi:hypothetical protein [Aquimarina sp. 2201CG14-23]|uniref:hypothetical protein n=1 Tax=Aquimarina mycalae TaxID=3040073 RepID=UPI002477F046|nr:hypothetical protein [Aquimarina sp. 2201CG14-23]MDH7445494.1 hypothetical protein [Aquimarina sp. 2201CG14-23]